MIIYEIYSELISLIVGWAVGFYIMASLLMYFLMAMSGGVANVTAGAGREQVDDYDDVPEIPRGIARSLSLASFGIVFSLLHVGVYALLVTVFTVQYMQSGLIDGGIITAGSQFHPYSMIYAWLIAGAFAVATAVAWYTADSAYNLIMSIVTTAARAFGLAGKWLVKRNGWQVDHTAVSTSLFLACFALLWSLALALAQYRPSPIAADLPSLWIVPATAVAVVLFYSVRLYRQHRDTLAILSTRIEELD